MPAPGLLLGAVLITWLVEWAVWMALARRCVWREGIALLLVNAVTNPLANAAYNLAHVPALAVECVVIVVEIPLFRLLVARRSTQAAALSLVGNGASGLLSILFCAGR
jgi:hypothetical protein